MKVLKNGMHFKIFWKRVSNFEKVSGEITLLESKIRRVWNHPYIQIQCVHTGNGAEFDIVIVSNQGVGSGSLNLSCSLQAYMNSFGFEEGWKVVPEDSREYLKIEEYLFS